jgi:FAD dependent oxidoreductase TIGR03364
MTPKYDVAIVGAGIAGAAHAWMAARRGLRVLIVERSPIAQGASVRNFGMVWVVGQPAGLFYTLAMQSRAFWMELARAGVVGVQECGSIHLAHHQDELAVLEEFRDSGTHQVQLLTTNDVLRQAPLANPLGLFGGMFSSTELRVDPRTAIHAIVGWLVQRHAVTCCHNTLITSIEDNTLRAADGRSWQAERIVICSGSDFQTLFPQILRTSGLQLCKLQMLKTAAQPADCRQLVHLASGLSLRHYASFQACPSLAGLRHRIAREMPELDRFGIHVLASQFPTGEIILGDSHEYGETICPFDNAEIDRLMLREMQKVICLRDWTIREHWHGVYARHPTLPVFEAECGKNVHLFVGPGGAGMTLSFGLAAQTWERWTGSDTPE